MGELTAILKLTDTAGNCGTVELNFLRWIVNEGVSAELLNTVFSRLRRTEPDMQGLVFIAAALQQVWQKENGVMVLLPPDLFKALDEPEVLIIVLLTTGNGGSMVFDLTSLYRTVFEGNLCVGDDEYGDPVRTEAFALRLVEKLKNAKTAPEKAPLPIEVFESVGCEGAVLATRLNPLLYEN